MCYDYARMLKDIEMLTDNYNIIERFSIGKSVMQKDIPCLKSRMYAKKKLLSQRGVSINLVEGVLMQEVLTDGSCRFHFQTVGR